MRIKIVSFTDKGGKLNLRLNYRLTEFFCQAVSGYAPFQTAKAHSLKPLEGSLIDWVENAFSGTDRADAIIFIGAAGIAVRSIAPFLKAKDKDPAVLVIDDTGRFVIPILSGHIGGANRLARQVAGILKAQAVITTATDANSVFAADSWAVEHGCCVPRTDEIKWIASALLRGEETGFRCDFPVKGALPEGVAAGAEKPCGITVSLDDERLDFSHTLHIVPKIVCLGVGCRKDASPELVRNFILETLAANRISASSVSLIASVDLKRGEPALVMLGEYFKVPFLVFSAAELNAVPGDFPSSSFVQSVTGTDNVCQRAALLASGNGKILLPKLTGPGSTLSVAIKEWRAEF